MSKNIRRVHGSRPAGRENDGYMYRYGISASYTSESHLHNCYEFVYIMNGNLVYTVEECEYFISAGDIVFTKPNELHSFHFPEKCEFGRQFFHIYPEYIKDFPEITQYISQYHRGRKNYIPSHLVEKYELNKIFFTMEKYSYDKPETRAAAYSCALLLMSKLNELLRIEDLENIHPVANETIYKILQYISSSLTQKITLDDISKATYLSPTYISTIFKKEMGMPLSSYINMRRIVLAKNRILLGEKITSLYLECGFDDYSTFYRAFSKYAGISPEKFKTNFKTV